MQPFSEQPFVRPSRQGRKALQELRDEDLIVKVQQGNRRAYEELVARYRDRLHSFILRMVKDHSEAEDVTQETLIRVYVHADKYRRSPGSRPGCSPSPTIWR